MQWLRRRVEAGEQNVEYWGLSATYACHLRMKPTVTVVRKRGQGSRKRLVPSVHGLGDAAFGAHSG
jgi:hypothetical protein